MIDDCYMIKKYEHPGYEEGGCAGLRTLDGEGEPCWQCKECKMFYLNQEREKR